MHFTLNPDEVEITAIRAQGAGGQNVNKVSSAAHLRFDIPASSRPVQDGRRNCNTTRASLALSAGA